MRYATNIKFNTNYPAIDQLIEKAKGRIPGFAFEYLDGGCNEEVNKAKNTTAIREIELRPRYLRNFNSVDLTTEIFGISYRSPFGVAPLGLQGLIWPNASEILAKAAFENQIPFVLSTVATSSIERIAEITEGQAWFQLYHPADNDIRDDLINRAQQAGCPVLVLLCDTPSYGFRPREIKVGLSMPPQMSIRNIVQMLGRPNWALQTLRTGLPNFANLEAYMPKKLNLSQLADFMNQVFDKRMNYDKIAAIRDRWPGKLILKGVASEEDAEMAMQLGLDGMIVSNHGGRQLDAAEASVKSLLRLVENYGHRTTLMVDSGLRSGPDIARVMAAGAQFTFFGRAFMYSVAALGSAGGEHMIGLLEAQLIQTMEQLGCEQIKDLPSHLISD
ncbi:MAG: alpha-hydroxy acid oxidase [Flavobacteriaceae bacterium]